MYFSVELNEKIPKGNFWLEENGGEIIINGEELIFQILDEKNFEEINEIKINKLINIKNNELSSLIISSIACRLPENINSPEQFWTLLKEGYSTNQRIPANRIIERNSLIRGDFNGGNIPVEGGHFLSFDLASFDPNFFGLSALEASALDPQQRLLLECTWECVQQVNFNSKKEIEECGVFIGFMSNEYYELTDQKGNALQMLGTAASAFSGRLAHFLDCKGPTLSIDTACSSSLVALQLAVEAIKTGKCPRAIVGGINLTLTAKGLAQRANAGMLSEDGCCRVFDSNANGYGRGDGCVVMMIEGISNDKLELLPHWGIIESIECGHDGHSSALNAPNGLSQQQLIIKCLENLNTEKKQLLSCWECHGTGTALGDPIEFLALAKALNNCGVKEKLLVGSAKANIGHTEAASGLVGVMKALLQLKYGEMPSLPNFKQINPEIVRGMEANGWENIENKWPIQIATVNTELKLKGKNKIQKLLAGVNSFGVSGTLCCAIISLDRSIEPKQIFKLHQQMDKYSSQKWQRLLPLQANSEYSINKIIKKYLNFVKNQNEWKINEICAASVKLINDNNNNFKNPTLNVKAVIIFPEENKEGKEPLIIKKSNINSIYYCLDFWPKIAWNLFDQVLSYQQAFNLILNKLGIKNKNIKELDYSIIKLSDTFGRFKILKDFGIIKKENEIINNNNLIIINLLREI
ncbi:hypothetical protein Mgra_00001619, partial [Meloidogyne graminicola]